MGVNCGLYARVSDKYNQEDNTSLEAQLRACREFALSRGWTIAREVKETMSGAFVLARPEFNGLLELASQSKLQWIVVDIPDRLGRGDAIAKLELLAEMNGCKIVYAKNRFDTSTVEGYTQKSVDQLVSGIERINITRRLAGGRRNRAREGQIIATSFRPYGNRIVSEYDDRGRKTACYLEVVEGEAKWVRQMFAWLVYEGMTPYGIAKKLTELKVPTLSDIDGRRKARGKVRSNGQWSRSTVLGMLKNETYDGRWYYGKRKVTRHDGPTITTTSRKRAADDENRICVPVPAILEPGIFEAAQKRLAENRRKNFKPTKYKYLLRHMIACIHDGTTMMGWTKSQGEVGYYRCRRNFPDYHELRCRSAMLRQDQAERIVWDYVVEELASETQLLAQIERRRQEAQNARNALVANIAALDAIDEKDRRKVDNLLDLYLEGHITREAYLSKKSKIEGDIEGRGFQRTDLQARLSASGVLSDDDERELQALREMVLKSTEVADFAARRKVLELLNVRCIWNDETRELTVTGLFRGVTLNVSSLCAVPHPE